MTGEARAAPTPQAAGQRNKPLLERRHRMQNEVLTGAMGMLVVAKAAVKIVQLHEHASVSRWLWAACGISLGLAAVAWLSRAATGPAAAMGGFVTLNILLRQALGVPWQQTAMLSLLALFVLTHGGTRFGRSRKEAMGMAEARLGRRASQVLANLGVAGLLAAGGTAGSRVSAAMLAGCIAALAEATADTVSSEMGQALGGTRWGRAILITTGKPVEAGTDGGISIAGSLCGAIGAGAVVLVSPFAYAWILAVCIFGASCVGWVCDSVLGATVERRGWLGNDLVNLLSTVVAAVVAFVAVLVT